MYMVLNKNDDAVRVLDTEDFVVDTVSPAQFREYKKYLGADLFYDATRYVKKRVGNLLLVWFVDMYGEGYEMTYYIGIEGTGLLRAGKIILPVVCGLGVHDKSVILTFRGKYYSDLPKEEEMV